METLPADVWRDRILPQLRLHDLVELRAVCHALYDIVESCLPWKGELFCLAVPLS